MSLETLALTIIESMIGAASSMMLTSTVRGGLRPIRAMSANEARDADSASLASLFWIEPVRTTLGFPFRSTNRSSLVPMLERLPGLQERDLD